MTCYREAGRGSEPPKGSSGCEAIHEGCGCTGHDQAFIVQGSAFPKTDLASWQAGSIPATHTEEQSRHAEVP